MTTRLKCKALFLSVVFALGATIFFVTSLVFMCGVLPTALSLAGVYDY